MNRFFPFVRASLENEPRQRFTDLVGAIFLNEMDSLHSHFGLIAPSPAKFTLAGPLNIAPGSALMKSLGITIEPLRSTSLARAPLLRSKALSIVGMSSPTNWVFSLVAQFGSGSRRLRSGEGLTILGYEFLDRHRLAAADFSDIVVRSGEDAVAVVDGDFMKVLHQE